jgi:NitT/TauT family transport system substrate-binding protein
MDKAAAVRYIQYMKNYKTLTCLAVLWLALAPLAALERVTVYGIRGPSGLSMIRLFEYPPRVSGFDIKTEALAQADLVAARLISGEAKMGILPPNVAAKIASSGKKLQAAAVTGLGMLSLLSSDPSVRRIEDLRGKTVEAAGQGATPDYVLRKILLSKGINPDRDIRIGYSLAYPEIVRSLITGRTGAALLPEPFATMARAGKPDLAVIGDIQDEWAKAASSGRNYPMTVFVVDADFAASRPLLIKVILASLRESVEWVVSNPAAAGVLAEKHDLGIRAEIAALAVPRSNYAYIPAAEARPALEALFRAFLEFSPSSIGGVLPPDAFYYR